MTWLEVSGPERSPLEASKVHPNVLGAPENTENTENAPPLPKWRGHFR